MRFPGTDARLTGEGIAQARKAGREFAKRGVLVDTVLVSPTRRTFDTMEFALQEMEGSGLVLPVKPRVIVVQGLLEKNPGGAAGTVIPETNREIDRISVRAGGESFPQFIERTENAFLGILRDIRTGRISGNEILVVGHSLVNRICLGVLQGVGGARGLEGESQINGGVKTVKIEV